MKNVKARTKLGYNFSKCLLLSFLETSRKVYLNMVLMEMLAKNSCNLFLNSQKQVLNNKSEEPKYASSPFQPLIVIEGQLVKIDI